MFDEKPTHNRVQSFDLTIDSFRTVDFTPKRKRKPQVKPDLIPLLKTKHVDRLDA